jgi:hypothetical protein
VGDPRAGGAGLPPYRRARRPVDGPTGRRAGGDRFGTLNGSSCRRRRVAGQALARLTLTRFTVAAATAQTAALAAPLAAQAEPVHVSFSVTSVSSTATGADFYAIGTVGHGSFGFDSALMPEGGTGQVGNLVMGLPTLALQFEWFGTRFDVGNASIATLRFTDGLLTDRALGGRHLPPPSAVCCAAAACTAPAPRRTSGWRLQAAAR